MRALFVAGVLVFDDGLHAAGGVAHDAAVTRRVGRLEAQQRQVLAAAGLHQGGGGAGADQRHVAVQDQRHGVGVVQRRHGLLHGVAGAQLRHLAHKHRTAGGGGGFNLVRAVAGDDDGAVCTHADSGIQNMLQ
jgi:hypothetical protein